MIVVTTENEQRYADLVNAWHCALVAAEYTAEDTFTLESRRELFEFGDMIACCGTARAYDVSPDGERFLMTTSPVGKVKAQLGASTSS